MKVKIIATLIIFLVLLAGCDISADQEKAQEVTSTFREVEYKGHSYIVFMYHPAGSYAGFGGLTHNPDCKCQKGDTDE